MGLAELKVQMQQYASNQYVQGGKDFLKSNSLVAKFAFLILILIVFMLLMSLGSLILSKVFSQNHNPILIDGMIDSTQMMTIPQDPSKKGAKPIYRSNNEREGLEFTWSVWIFINDITVRSTEFKHVFHKGNNSIVSGSFNATSNSKAGLNAPLNGPGLYIMPVQKDAKNGNVAALRIIMNTFGQIDNNIDIKNIPLNKWVNVIMRVTKQGQLDVYINGVLVKRLMLNSVPKQNYGDIFVSLNGGFAGNTSSLRYFEKAIGTNQVQSIFNKGPDTKMVVGNMPSTEKVTNKYLATRWYMKSAVDV
jgi:hypothetical protein